MNNIQKIRKKILLEYIPDLVTNFIYYDRQEDEEISEDILLSVLDEDFINEIVFEFKEKILEYKGNNDK